MMLLDGCFIVELFRNVGSRDDAAEVSCPIYNTKWILPIISLDMLLLENERPFLVHDRLLQFVNKSNTGLALRFFDHLMPMYEDIPPMCSIHHLLHFYYHHLLPTPLQSDILDQGNHHLRLHQFNCPPIALNTPPAGKMDRRSSHQRNVSLRYQRSNAQGSDSEGRRMHPAYWMWNSEVVFWKFHPFASTIQPILYFGT